MVSNVENEERVNRRAESEDASGMFFMMDSGTLLGKTDFEQ